MFKQTFSIFFACLIQVIHSYHPVFLMHGFDGSAQGLKVLEQNILDEHPGTTVVNINLFNNASSFVGLWTQLEGITAEIRLTVLSNPEFWNGYHLVCHSQGALLCRCVQEYMIEHNVIHFLSLAGPQAGVFGMPIFQPNEQQFAMCANEAMYIILYTSYMQELYSLANYWVDPFQHSMYLQNCTFLPIFNNIVNHSMADAFYRNFNRTKGMYYFGSDADEIVIPWDSSMWRNYAVNDTSITVPVEKTAVWTNLPIKEMFEDDRLFFIEVPGVSHDEWINNKTIFTDYIAPLLT